MDYPNDFESYLIIHEDELDKKLCGFQFEIMYKDSFVEYWIQHSDGQGGDPESFIITYNKNYKSYSVYKDEDIVLLQDEPDYIKVINICCEKVYNAL